MKRIGMGLVGPGFVAAHHIDAVRRLGFVDVVAVAASSEASARRKADALGVPKAYGSYEALVADPDVHVVHNTTPNYLHVPGHPGRARSSASTSISDKPLAMTAADAQALWRRGARGRRRPRGHVQLSRQPAGAAGARDDRRRRARRRCTSSTAPTCRTGCSRRRTSRGGSSRDKGGQSSAIGDIGSHWCDLVAARHRPADRRGARRPDDGDRHAAEAGRRRPRRSRRRRRGAREPFAISSEDLATVLVRFDGGAKGCVSVGQVCAGHKNGLWFEVNGRQASLRWEQERQNELWIGAATPGQRDARRRIRRCSPGRCAALRASARRPSGRLGRRVLQRACATSTTFIASRQAAGGSVSRRRFATFEDGYRSACIVEAILESHANGNAWTTV